MFIELGNFPYMSFMGGKTLVNSFPMLIMHVTVLVNLKPNIKGWLWQPCTKRNISDALFCVETLSGRSSVLEINTDTSSFLYGHVGHVSCRSPSI